MMAYHRKGKINMKVKTRRGWVQSMSLLFGRVLPICLGILLATLVAVPVYSANASGNSPKESVQAAPAGGPIYKYLIHVGTGGPVACGDNLVPIYVGARTGDTEKDVATALNGLFATSKYSGGLYNPLADSKLRARKVEYNPSNRNATVHLGGRLVKPKTSCDIQRARAMVWATAQQFPEVQHAIIWIGGSLLGDLLAAKDRAKE
jgi:hypothetical protein